MSKAKSVSGANNTPVISFNELMSELDKYRVTAYRDYTPEQDKFILACRTPCNKVPFKDMIVLWEKAGWGEVNEWNLNRRLKILLRNQEMQIH